MNLSPLIETIITLFRFIADAFPFSETPPLATWVSCCHRQILHQIPPMWESDDSGKGISMQSLGLFMRCKLTRASNISYSSSQSALGKSISTAIKYKLSADIVTAWEWWMLNSVSDPRSVHASISLAGLTFSKPQLGLMTYCFCRGPSNQTPLARLCLSQTLTWNDGHE